MMPCLLMRAGQGPDFSTERESGSVGECWQEDDPDKGKKRSHRWIWITQDYEASLSYHDGRPHFVRLCFLRARSR